MTSDITRPAETSGHVKRSRLGRLLGVQVVGVGSYAPEVVVRNEDLVALGHDPDWIVQRTGIRQRRHAPPGMATSDMAVEAAKRCIAESGVDPREIDLVLLGTFTPDLLLPATACLVQDRLGLRAPALDLHAACSSFIFALLTGMQYVASGCSRLVLVIGADCNSRVLNPRRCPHLSSVRRRCRGRAFGPRQPTAGAGLVCRRGRRVGQRPSAA